jgi:hypothetical protein
MKIRFSHNLELSKWNRPHMRARCCIRDTTYEYMWYPEHAHEFLPDRKLEAGLLKGFRKDARAHFTQIEQEQD